MKILLTLFLLLPQISFAEHSYKLLQSDKVTSSFANVLHDKLSCYTNFDFGEEGGPDCTKKLKKCTNNSINSLEMICNHLSKQNPDLKDHLTLGDCSYIYLQVERQFPDIIKKNSDLYKYNREQCWEVYKEYSKKDAEDFWKDINNDRNRIIENEKVDYVRVCRTKRRDSKNINTGEITERIITVCDLERKKTQGEINRKGFGYLLDKLF